MNGRTCCTRRYRPLNNCAYCVLKEMGTDSTLFIIMHTPAAAHRYIHPT